MLKKPSQTKRVADAQAVEALADAIADRTYGDEPNKTEAQARPRPLSVSLPAHLILCLEDEVRANKLSGEGPRTVSGVVRQALKKAGYRI
jgi:hypothetical protein